MKDIFLKLMSKILSFIIKKHLIPNQLFEEKYLNTKLKYYFLQVGIQYPEKLHELHNGLPFLAERMKIEKLEKLVTNLHDKTEYAIHVRRLKEALDHGLIFMNIYS